MFIIGLSQTAKIFETVNASKDPHNNIILDNKRLLLLFFLFIWEILLNANTVLISMNTNFALFISNDHTKLYFLF
jgi:hypothetical protein